MVKPENLEIDSCQASLYEFFQSAWHVLEKAPFVDNWHLEAISEHLEAVYNREIKNLIINVPPRTGKTLLISVAFPAWVWLKNAAERFLCVSCVNSLSLEHAIRNRALIESPWYKDRWCNPNSPHYKFRLKSDQNQKSFFENSEFGYRQSTSVNSKTVGRGGSIIIIDDPNDPGDQSAVKRNNVIDWWNLKMSTRSNNPIRDCRIIVQQRTHEQDLTGYILKNDTNSDWTSLILPMEFENSRKSTTVILPNSLDWDKKAFQDPRQKEGALLVPQRFGVKEVLKLRAELGTYGYAGQCQQRPSPLEGGILKKDWFKIYQEKSLPVFTLVLQSWDTAFSDSPTAAYSACTTWGLFEFKGVINILLLSCWRGRVGYPELRDRAARLHKNYLDRTDEVKITRGVTVDKCIIEAKATGSPLLQDLRKAGVPTLPYQPKGDKTARVQQVSAYIEAGIVQILDKPENLEFINEVATFPNAESRDYVDTLSQILGYLRDNNMLMIPKDPKLPEARTDFTVPYFKTPD